MIVLRLPRRAVRFLARFLLGVILLGAAYADAWLLPDEALPPVPDYHGAAVFEPAVPETPPVVLATAYCPCPICCGRWADGRTATGTIATEGRTLAADPATFAPGACLDLAGVGRRIVEDTGSAIIGDRVDVYFRDHQAALEFGRRLLYASECWG